MDNPYKIKIQKAIQKLGVIYSVWDVFSDFVELGAISIANSFKNGSDVWKKRERQYLNTIGKYKPDEQKLFTEMFSDLVMALDHEVSQCGALTDILGELYHALELHNKYKGQFFTPQHVCDMMSKIIAGNLKNQLAEKGYISLCEPCCGSGAMIIGFANTMREQHLNYSAQLFVEATDVDLKCVYMCYLQLSLYGIPAVVIHGNSLTLEEWSQWLTPVFIWNGWSQRLKTGDSTPKSGSADNKSSSFEQLTLDDL